jgi:arginase
MGPFVLRQEGLWDALVQLGHCVEDHGNLTPVPVSGAQRQNPQMRNLNEAAGWTRRLMLIAESLLRRNVLPIWLGGDHSLSLGTVAGAAAYAKSAGRTLFVLWLDAHPDFNTFETTLSGNTHGVPVAFFCGLPGFDPLLGRPLDAHVEPANVHMLGIRSVDNREQDLMRQFGVRAHAMQDVRMRGVERVLRPFLDEVVDADGLLHVSLDVDFLDPSIAPATGTTVPGGATISEARQLMALLCESGLVTSLDIAEFNPRLDEGGRTARLLVDLVARLFGQPFEGRRFLSRESSEMPHHARSSSYGQT